MHRGAVNYVPAAASLSFPGLSMDKFWHFVEMGLTGGQSAAVRAFRAWLTSGRGEL
jgi:hypothetical protein